MATLFSRHFRLSLYRLHELLAQFVAQGSMRLPGKKHEPCYRISAA